MRDSTELAEDLSNLSSMDWNIKLAKEYGMTHDQFISTVNSYAYISTSEDAIHSKMKPLHLVKPNEPKRSDSDSIINISVVDDMDNSVKISSIVRNLGSLLIDPGGIIIQKIMCGFICEDSLLSNTLIKSSVFNNCIFTNSDFACSKIIQTKFIDCDFTNTDFRGAVVSKSQFYECVFNESQLAQIIMSDVILYKCQIQHTDSDDTTFITCTMHDCDFSNTHLKRSKILGSVLSYSIFNNTILNEMELYDTNLISIDLSKSEMRGITLCDCSSTSLKIDSIYAEQFGFVKTDSEDEESFEETTLDDNLDNGSDQDDSSEEDFDE